MAEVTTMPAKHRKNRPPAAPPSAPEPAEAAPPVENPPDSPPPAAEPEKNKTGRGRPSKDAPQKTDPPFFDLVRAIPKEDWGTRAWLYVYLSEPICEPHTFGKYNYMEKRSTPMLDLQPLADDYGSFKGWMSLNRRKQGAQTGEQIDRYEFTIYNPKYPPKIPKAAWINDPRNKKWADLLPTDPPKPEPAQGAADPGKLFDVFERMADRVEARYAREEPDPPPDPASQFQAVVNTTKEMLAMVGPKATDNGIIRDELNALRAELSAERAENRLLMREMLNSKTNSTQPVGATDPLDMFDKMMDRVDKIKERVAPENNGAEAVRASRMNGWQEFGLEIARGLFGSPAVAQLAQGFVIWAMSKNNGQQPAANQATSGQQPQPQTAGALPPAPANQDPGAPPMKLTAQQLSSMIGPQLISPVMIHLTDRDKDGYDLADWVIAGKGQDAFEFLRNHGPEVIIESFRLSPFWAPQGNGTPGLGSMEPQLRELVNEFCSWPPPDEDEHEEDEHPQTAAPINLMDEAAETGE